MSLAHQLHGPEGAPILVLANSLGTSQELWNRQLPDFAEGFRVLTFDLPGHGLSDLPAQHATVDAFAGSLVELLGELGLDRISFCGVSVGGMVGMALALREPDRVERLVLTCTSAHLGPAGPWEERARTVRADGMSSIADVVVARWFTPALLRDEPETVARFHEQFVATPPEGYARCCEAIAAWDVRELVSAIAVPVLVVAGADDPAIPVEHAELLAARIPDARLRVLDRAAHLPNVERADAFTALVLEHLGQEVAA
jgi:3-oxoadipate enol-lactonase